MRHCGFNIQPSLTSIYFSYCLLLRNKESFHLIRHFYEFLLDWWHVCPVLYMSVHMYEGCSVSHNQTLVFFSISNILISCWDFYHKLDGTNAKWLLHIIKGSRKMKVIVCALIWLKLVSRLYYCQDLFRCNGNFLIRLNPRNSLVDLSTKVYCWKYHTQRDWVMN